MNKVGEIAKQLAIKRINKNGIRFYEISDPCQPNEEKLLYPSVSTVLSIIDQPMFKKFEREKLYTYLKNSIENSLKTGVPMSKKEQYLIKQQTLHQYSEQSKNILKYGSIIGTDSHNVIEEVVDSHLEKNKTKLKPLKSLVETKEIIKKDENDNVISSSSSPSFKKTQSQLALETTTISKELLDNVPSKVKNVKSSFEEWEKSSGLKLEHNDTLVFSKKYKFAGACDAVARKQNGELVVLDWKTSTSMSINYALQISAYSKAIEEMTGEKISEAWIVKFDKDLPIYNTYSVKDIDSCFNHFLSALNLWNIYNFKNDDLNETTETYFFNHLPFASRFNKTKSKDNINNNNNNNNSDNLELDFSNSDENIEDNKISFSKSGGIIIPDTIKKIKTK
ncbi:hypothetical protein ACTFIV_000934 [Dictyostelium citrinum]